MSSVPSYDVPLFHCVNSLDRRLILSPHPIYLSPEIGGSNLPLQQVIQFVSAVIGLLHCSVVHPLRRRGETHRRVHEDNKEVSMTSSNKLPWGVYMLAVGLGIAGSVWPTNATTEGTSVNLPIEMVADYVHAVIEADRDVYTRHVVERLQAKGVVVASENWEQKNTLPLPAQFLMESGRVMAKKGIGIQYRLISLWPINKRNVAASEFEKTGLGAALTHPTKPHTGFVKEGGTNYFQAVYPDLAVTQACIGCHNAHQDSPKRDFKINDVMGAIVISIPVKQ
jgi:hypothetical protein